MSTDTTGTIATCVTVERYTPISLILVGLGMLVLITGCSHSSIIEAQEEVRSYETFSEAEVEAITTHLDDVYRHDGEDRVLYHLEKGMVYHYYGEWETSSHHLERAERAIEENYTRSITQNVSSLLVNDLERDYFGEAYEDFYINVINSLNYLHRGDMSGAAVESRRVTQKLDTFSDRYRGLAASLANPPDTSETISADTTQIVLSQVDDEFDDVDLSPDELEEKAGAMNQHSTMARFLTTVVSAKGGEPDRSRIEYKQLQTAASDQGRGDFIQNVADATRSAYTPPQSPQPLFSLGSDSLFDEFAPALNSVPGQTSSPPMSDGGIYMLENSDQLTDGTAYNTVVMAFGGRLPAKREEAFSIPVEIGDDTITLDFAVPVLSPFQTQIDEVQVTHEDTGEAFRLPMVENMHAVARRVFDETKSAIYVRAVLRSFIQAAATKGAADLADEELGAGAGFLAAGLGNMASSQVTRADLRTAQTLPGQAYGLVLDLSPGTHTLTFQYLSRSGRVLHEQSREVSVREQENNLSVATGYYLR